MENCGNNLFDNEEAVNELSDADLLKLEQALKYTAEFIGVNTQNIQGGTGYRAIQAEFSDPFGFLQFIRDSKNRNNGLYTLPSREDLKQLLEQLIDKIRFSNMTPLEQMQYMNKFYE
jgi:hypothetical protein